MTTYGDLAARRGGTAVFWAEIRGIPWVPTSGQITESNKSTLFGDAYTPTQTMVTGLRMPEVVFARSIEPLQGSGQQGTFSIELVDWKSAAYPDGFYTWLFGGDRLSIFTTRLMTQDIPHHAGGLGHDWLVEDASGFVAGGNAYCGLETVSPDSIDTIPPAIQEALIKVTRSMWKSPNMAHNRDQSGTYPKVTDHPTKWLGRVLSLYQTYMDGDGSLASTGGTSATARAAAFVMRGVIKQITHEDGVWKISVDSLDTLLRRKAMRGTPQGELSPQAKLAGSFYLANGPGTSVWDETETRVFDVGIWDPLDALNVHVFRVMIPNGIYAAESLVAAVNEALAPTTIEDEAGNNTFLGQLSVSLGTDSVTWAYTTDPTPGNERICSILAITAPSVVVFGELSTIQDTVWGPLGIQFPERINVGTDSADFAFFLPQADTEYVTVIPRESVEAEFLLGGGGTVALKQGPGLATAGDFPDGCYVVVSSDGVKAHILCARNPSPTDNTLELHNALGSGQRGIRHKGEHVTVRLAYFAGAMPLDSPAGHVLRVLLSTGESAFNHPSYDSEETGVGIEIPHMTPNAGADDTDSLLDVASVERFFSEVARHYIATRDLLYEGTEVLAWLTDKLAFLGGWLVVRNGQIAVVRGLVPLSSGIEATIDASNLTSHSNAAGDDRLVVDGVSYRCNWNWTKDEHSVSATTQLGDGSSDMGDQAVEFEDKGIVSTPELLLRLGITVLGDYAKEPWRYKVTCDRVLWRVEPGAVVSFSDEGAGDDTDDTRLGQGAPSPFGDRGFDGTAMLVLSSEMDLAAGTTTLELAHIRRRRSGWAASCWISDYTNIGAAVLSVDDNFFRPVADGLDCLAFTVGDKVAIHSVNPTQAGAEPGLETGEAGLTIASIDPTPGACTITLTGTLSVAWPSPPAAASQCIVLVHDKYGTVGQTVDAKSWCWMGDTSGDIDDGGDAVYEW